MTLEAALQSSIRYLGSEEAIKSMSNLAVRVCCDDEASKQPFYEVKGSPQLSQKEWLS